MLAKSGVQTLDFGRENPGILAGLCLKGENSRVAAIIGSYPAILPQ